MYTPSKGQATVRYIKDKQYILRVLFRKDYYEAVLKPLMTANGKTASAFVKEAIIEKLQREGHDVKPFDQTIQY